MDIHASDPPPPLDGKRMIAISIRIYEAQENALKLYAQRNTRTPADVARSAVHDFLMAHVLEYAEYIESESAGFVRCLKSATHTPITKHAQDVPSD
jgi:hypothetical protein